MQKLGLLILGIIGYSTTVQAAPELAKIIAAITQRTTQGAALPSALLTRGSAFANQLLPGFRPHVENYIYVGENIRGHQLLVNALPVETRFVTSTLRTTSGLLIPNTATAQTRGNILVLVGGRVEQRLNFFSANLDAVNVEAREAFTEIVERVSADSGMRTPRLQMADSIYLRGLQDEYFVFTPYTIDGALIDPVILERILTFYSPAARAPGSGLLR